MEKFGNLTIRSKIKLIFEITVICIIFFSMIQTILIQNYHQDQNGVTYIAWFGNGPHESYWDRQNSALVGTYEKSIDEFCHNYVYPQENGNRTQVRWVKITNDKKQGLLIQGQPLIDFSIWNYTMESLEQATHIHELSRSNFNTLNIDYRQSGVGGVNSWFALPLEQYRLKIKEYSYNFVMSPIGFS